GNIYINEINTIPGMTAISLFPRMAAAGGLDFTAMLEKLIEGALNEFAYKEGLSYKR
ncbi:MAG: D-alanine--D-alanine ligase, partial [Spirochaetaceae bacterium]|nr:D-alanine--D-alanine ligase [Spirochaetaceae bacterium]